MRLFDSILDVNRRKLAGDRAAAVSAAEFAAALPLAALTCIDVRLNHLLPDALGIAEEQFIWLRNAGNIIRGTHSSTMRSIALACAVKGAKEIAVIGHTDCLVAKTTTLQLLDRFAGLGIERQRLPENLVEYFGLFGSERQNVIRSVDFARMSPLIGPRVPVHGLLLDVTSGRLDWIVNGYDTLPAVVPGKAGELLSRADRILDALEQIGHVASEELKLPESRIGEFTSTAHEWLQRAGRVAVAVTKDAGPEVPAKSTPPVAPNPRLAGRGSTTPRPH